jgi:hypothetical protein
MFSIIPIATVSLFVFISTQTWEITEEKVLGKGQEEVWIDENG